MRKFCCKNKPFIAVEPKSASEFFFTIFSNFLSVSSFMNIDIIIPSEILDKKSFHSSLSLVQSYTGCF